MNAPKIMLCTLALNEIEWLPKLYEQHKQWPNLVKWVFVESADVEYKRVNPSLVSGRGLSIDGTTDFLVDLCLKDDRVRYIPHGLTEHSDIAQGKCQARNRYLEIADEVKPDFLIVVDADEFWPKDCQRRLPEWLDNIHHSFSFDHKEVWHPPSIKDEPLFRYQVVGGFWNILYCRGWKYVEGMRYINNHNTPVTPDGILMDKKMKDYRSLKSRKITQWQRLPPYFVHLGFASDPKFRIAKNNYYEGRGEGRNDHRGWYVDSRKCFETWKPGSNLPNGARVIRYDGVIPECFREVEEKV